MRSPWAVWGKNLFFSSSYALQNRKSRSPCHRHRLACWKAKLVSFRRRSKRDPFPGDEGGNQSLTISGTFNPAILRPRSVYDATRALHLCDIFFAFNKTHEDPATTSSSVLDDCTRRADLEFRASSLGNQLVISKRTRWHDRREGRASFGAGTYCFCSVGQSKNK